MANHTYDNHLSLSRRVAVTAMMTAIALVGNYSLVMIPNVELGSTVLFVTAFLFGLQMAVSCVFLVSTIFAFFNPWGPFIPAIWITQVVGWLFIVTAGWIMGKREGSWTSGRVLGLTLVGAIVTLFFDVVTTMGYSWSFSVPFVLALISGIPFMAVHLLSNAVLFPLVVPKLDMALRRQAGHLSYLESEGGTEQEEMASRTGWRVEEIDMEG